MKDYEFENLLKDVKNDLKDLKSTFYTMNDDDKQYIKNSLRLIMELHWYYRTNNETEF